MTGLPASPPCACVVPLAELDAGQQARFGAKAATLGRLLRKGFEVPDGFGIAAGSFALGEDGALDPRLAALILGAYRQLGAGPVAVRSSAQDEDQAGRSNAGIYESLLGVLGERALLDAVRHCLVAVDAPRATVQRLVEGRAGRRPAMGLLVQRMVLADVAGVLYTLDPVSGRRDRLCLNATPGLGDVLAAGHVNGETQLTDRGGRLLHTDRLPGVASVLTPGHRLALADLARRLEAEFAGPLDVEFAFEADRLRLLQVRPVAASELADARLARGAGVYLASERARLRQRLERLHAAGVVRAGEGVLSNGNIAELLPNASPLSLDLFQRVFTARGGAIARGRRRLGYRIADDAAESLLETFCGQPYFNLEVDARTFDAGYPLDIAGYLAAVRADPQRANYPEFGLYEQVPTLDQARRRFGAREGRRLHAESRAFQAGLRAHAEFMLGRWRAGARERMAAAAREAGRIDWAGMDTQAEIVAALERRVAYLRDSACVEFVAAARLGFFFAERLRVGLDALAPGDAESWRARLLGGLAGSRITDLALDLERLGRGELGEDDWLAVYGHLAPNELELTSPRYREMPAAIALLARRLARAEPAPAARHAGQVAERVAAERDLAVRLRELASDEAEEWRLDLRLAQSFLPLRETVKFHYTAEYAAIRAAVLRLSEILDLEPDLLFHARLDELGRAPDRARLAARREARHLGRRLLREGRLPAVIHEGAIPTLGAANCSDGAREFAGRPMAPGYSVGRVRLLDLERDDPVALLADLSGGEVLVTRSANLGLSSLFRLCAGLVVEVGGVLAHAACQARESGIPAVVLEDATRLLRDGMRVRLDGARGSVSIVEA